jgi:hypothetical protein
MDFDAAIAAHADWKVNFRIALATHSTVDAQRACSDKNCALGHWLHGEARAKLAGDKTYLQCVEAHRDFHDAAGEVASAINRKDFQRAADMIEVGSKFHDASMRVAVAVRRLKAMAPA